MCVGGGGVLCHHLLYSRVDTTMLMAYFTLSCPHWHNVRPLTIDVWRPAAPVVDFVYLGDSGYHTILDALLINRVAIS